MPLRSVTLCGLLLVAALICATPSDLLAQNLVIVDWAWTSGIRNLEPVDELNVEEALDPQPIYLWLLIEADAAALKELETRGKLPIRCRWTRIYEAEEDKEAGELIDEIKLGIGARELAPKLRGEIDGRQCSCFDWRTWSRKKRVTEGNWKVEVVFSGRKREPVLCRYGEGEAPAPCEFTFSIR